MALSVILTNFKEICRCHIMWGMLSRIIQPMQPSWNILQREYLLWSHCSRVYLGFQSPQPLLPRLQSATHRRMQQQLLLLLQRIALKTTVWKKVSVIRGSMRTEDLHRHIHVAVQSLESIAMAYVGEPIRTEREAGRNALPFVLDNSAIAPSVRTTL